MSNPWFRMYAEFATDPKVQMLSETDQRRYVMLLCLRCNGDVTLHETEIAFQLRISNEEWAKTKAVLVEKNLLTSDNNPTAWDKRQYASDSSAERVRKHRENKRNSDVTLQKQPDNVVDTDTDTDNTNANALVVAGKPTPNCPHQKIIDLYIGILVELPCPATWEGQRQQHLAARWKWVLTAKKRDGSRYATTADEALDFFRRFFEYVAQSDFLTGRDGKWSNCDLGWLVKAENFSKVMSGNYENKAAA